MTSEDLRRKLKLVTNTTPEERDRNGRQANAFSGGYPPIGPFDSFEQEPDLIGFEQIARYRGIADMCQKQFHTERERVEEVEAENSALRAHCSNLQHELNHKHAAIVEAGFRYRRMRAACLWLGVVLGMPTGAIAIQLLAV